MAGLLVYLMGPGRHNEHTEPHLVAGDDALMAWHAESELDRDAALSIARHLERPRVAFGVEVPRGHVWHCSLSLRAEEGALTDEQWGAIASEFVTRMGFDDAEGTKAACRWVAVRHGESANGNDHVHLAVNLVREDGTKASVHRDFQRAQDAARGLEVEFGLERLESAEMRATRGFDPAEREAQARGRARGQYEHERLAAGGSPVRWERLDAAERAARVGGQMRADQPRHGLARSVRACATSSTDEGEFVRRLRRAGVLVKPRYAEGHADVITGYAVAERPRNGERPIWYGGGNLGRDLTLPRLRQGWPDTPQGASTAAGEWNAARRGRRPVAPGREMTEPDPGLWQQYANEIGALREQLRSVPAGDHATWAHVARETAGAFAAWSARVEPVPGPLAATADALARSAQTRSAGTPARLAFASASGGAMLLMQAARGGKGTAAEAIMLRQFANLAKALYDMHTTAGEAHRAAEIAAVVRGQLAQVAAQLDEPVHGGAPAVEARLAETARRAHLGQPPVRPPGSVVPSRLEPQRPRLATGPGRDGGQER